MIEKEHLLSIQRPQENCSECGTTLDEFEHHPTRLRIHENAAERSDFCPDCWEFAKEEVYDSYWITRRVKKEKRVPKLSRREKAVAARALFESLWDRRDAEDLGAHLYVLAHLLLRWGGLKWKSNRLDDREREIVEFENPATGDPIELPAVQITEESITEITERIEQFLRDYAPEYDVAVE